MIPLTGASFSVPNFRGKICKSWAQHLIWGSIYHVGCQEVLTLRYDENVEYKAVSSWHQVYQVLSSIIHPAPYSK